MVASGRDRPEFRLVHASTRGLVPSRRSQGTWPHIDPSADKRPPRQPPRAHVSDYDQPRMCAAGRSALMVSDLSEGHSPRCRDDLQIAPSLRDPSGHESPGLVRGGQRRDGATLDGCRPAQWHLTHDERTSGTSRRSRLGAHSRCHQVVLAEHVRRTVGNAEVTICRRPGNEVSLRVRSETGSTVPPPAEITSSSPSWCGRGDRALVIMPSATGLEVHPATSSRQYFAFTIALPRPRRPPQGIQTTPYIAATLTIVTPSETFSIPAPIRTYAARSICPRYPYLDRPQE